MAKTKITALTTLADGSIANGDLIPIVDIDDTSQAASGTTKKVTITSLASAVATAFSGDSPTFVNLTTTGTTTLGDSGDATTINGTLGVTGVSTLTGSVGIGAAPTVKLQVETSAGNGFKFTESGTPGGYYGSFTVDGTGVKIDSGSGVRDLRLRIGASDKLTIDTTGAVTMAGTLGVTGVATFTDNIVMASGKGIDFSATANSSGTMTSELLNDYEEGTWSATMRGDTTAGSFSATIATAKYVKIGSLVTLIFRFENGTLTGATGDLVVSGFPFTVNGAVSCAFPYHYALNTTYDSAMISLQNGGTAGNVVAMDAAGSQSVVQSSGVSGTYLSAVITYRT